MTRSIDIARFECIKCGHRCTPPESINVAAQQMEIYADEKQQYREEEGLGGEILLIPILDTIGDTKKKQELESKHQGNKVTIRQEGDKKVTRFERSYATVVPIFDRPEHPDPDEIILNCPQCSLELYRTHWRKKR